MKNKKLRKTKRDLVDLVDKCKWVYVDELSNFPKSAIDAAIKRGLVIKDKNKLRSNKHDN